MEDKPPRQLAPGQALRKTELISALSQNREEMKNSTRPRYFASNHGPVNRTGSYSLIHTPTSPKSQVACRSKNGGLSPENPVVLFPGDPLVVAERKARELAAEFPGVPLDQALALRRKRKRAAERAELDREMEGDRKKRARKTTSASAIVVSGTGSSRPKVDLAAWFRHGEKPVSLATSKGMAVGAVRVVKEAGKDGKGKGETEESPAVVEVADKARSSSVGKQATSSIESSAKEPQEIRKVKQFNASPSTVALKKPGSARPVFSMVEHVAGLKKALGFTSSLSRSCPRSYLLRHCGDVDGNWGEKNMYIYSAMVSSRTWISDNSNNNVRP
ncbi:hypothetical protein VTN00DRAFT_2026 [Thermoascus crustaceus]|uniref:uncharacterized protein n=1 Tax=Thermoascus crustaceus TaxID=5088 RepID=UPI0037448CF5